MGFRCPADGRRTAGKILAQREACRIPALRGLPGHLDLLPTAFPNRTACCRKQGWTQCCLPSHLPPSSVLPVGEAQNGRGKEDQPPLINPGPSISPWISQRALHSLHGQRRRRRTCPRRGAMVSYRKRLACLLVAGAVYPAVFLLSVLIQYAGTVFPPGIDQPLKARICQTMLIAVLILVRFHFFFHVLGEKNCIDLIFS